MTSREIPVMMLLALLSGVCSAYDLYVNKELSSVVVEEGGVLEVEVSVGGLDSPLKGETQAKGQEGSFVFYDPIPPFAGYVVHGSPTGAGESRKAFFNPGLKVVGAYPPGGKIKYSIVFNEIPEALKGRSDSLGRAVFGTQEGLRVSSPPVGIRYGGSNPKCNFNFQCEKELGESYATCPQDCLSGGDDNYCDQRRDGLCDPDCGQSLDADCFTEAAGSCGNGVCESFESKLSCPQDCVPRETTTTTVKGLQAAVRRLDRKTVVYFLALASLAVAVILVLQAKQKHEEHAKGKKEAHEQETVNKLKKRLQDGEDPAKLVGEGYSKRLVDEAGRQIWKR
jgi:hypothetical protein